MATKTKVDKLVRMEVSSLQNALEILEGAQDGLKVKWLGAHDADKPFPGGVLASLTSAASHTRGALRALGVDIPVRKGPKPRA